MVRKMPWVSDWQAVRNKLEHYEWARQIVAKVRPETDWWVAHYEDDVNRVAGWGHNYFCENCFTMLTFDRSKPNDHTCGSCGQVRRDDKANDAWTYMYRATACSQAFHAAVLYNLFGDTGYLEYIRRVIRFLSDHYGSFSVRTPPGQEGMFSGCDLTDAVSVIQLLNGMELVKEQFTQEELCHWKQKFFIPLAGFLIEKFGCTPNINVWMRAAAGMIGLFFDERVWCERAADCEHGIRNKMSEGVLPSGFWYESSFHYHYYNADGLTHYLVFCKIYGYDNPELEDWMLRMYRYPVMYAFPNGMLPSPNDGWPLLSFANYAHQYERIRSVYDEAPFRYALSHCYDDSEYGVQNGKIGGIERLLFGTDWKAELAANPFLGDGLPDGKSRHDPHIFYSMLQNGDALVFMKYGFLLSGHSHADIMNIEIYLKDEIISRDIANSGYNSDLFREWQRKTIAHNSVMVDGSNQPNRPRGQLLEFDAGRNLCRAAADGVYPGIRFERHLELQHNRLIDEFVVKAMDGHTDEHTFDWLFHCSGELKHNLPLIPAVLPGDKDGYQLMLDTASCEIDGDWEMRWELPDKTLSLTMAGSPGTKIYVFRGYEHSMDRIRYGVMVRRTGTEAMYRASYRFTF